MELFQFETIDGSLISVETVEESPLMREMVEVESQIRKKAGALEGKPIHIDAFDQDGERLDPTEGIGLVKFRTLEFPKAVIRDGGARILNYRGVKDAKISEGDEFRIAILPSFQFTLLEKGKIVIQKSISEF